MANDVVSAADKLLLGIFRQLAKGIVHVQNLSLRVGYGDEAPQIESLVAAFEDTDARFGKQGYENFYGPIEILVHFPDFPHFEILERFRFLRLSKNQFEKKFFELVQRREKFVGFYVPGIYAVQKRHYEFLGLTVPIVVVPTVAAQEEIQEKIIETPFVTGLELLLRDSDFHKKIRIQCRIEPGRRSEPERKQDRSFEF